MNQLADMSVLKPKTLPLNLALKQRCILQTPIGYGLLQVTLFLSISRVTVTPTEAYGDFRRRVYKLGDIRQL